MKLLTRTSIVLITINLIIGNFALTKETPVEPPRLISESAPPSSNPALIESTPPLESSSIPMPTRQRMVTISGNVGLSGVEMTGLPGHPVTDQNGFYSATVLPGWTGTVRPKKDGFIFEPVEFRYGNVIRNLTNNNYSPKRIGPTPMFGRTGGREILVIPATDIKAENLSAVTEDLQVMTHIFDERFKELQEIQGVFVDFGDFFGRDSRQTEAIYIQGYGVLFLMEVNFAFSPELKPEEKQTEEAKDVDPIWQKARQKIFAPTNYSDLEFETEQKYSADKIEQLKQELVRTLKHTANIRNIQPDEMIILTVIGKSRQSGGMYQYGFSRSRAPRTRTSRSSGRSSSRTESGMYGMGGIGGYSVSGGMGGGMGGGSGMGGGMGGSMGSGGFSGGMMMRGGMGMMGGTGGFKEDYSQTDSAPATVLTIRAIKSDVDNFAKGKLNFEQFQEKVDIFTY